MRSSMVTASAIVLCVAAPSWAQRNLVANPGFEAVAQGLPQAWATEDWGTGGRPAPDAAVRHAGRRSARVDCETEKSRAVWRQIVPVAGPGWVRFSAWYRTRLKAPGPKKGASVRLILFRDAGKWQEVGMPSYYGPPAERWAQLAATVRLPAEVTAVGIELFNLEAAGSVWWDDVMLRKATETETREAEAEALEVPPSPYTVRYAPADGSTSALDPPAFVWLPVDGAREYTLQYSRSARFGAKETTTVACGRTITVPRQVLGAGKWHWRFGVPGEGGRTFFSRARAFTIAEDAAKVPFPDLKAVAARLEGVRPRDFVREEDLPRLRETAAGDLKDYLAAMRNDCKRYLGQAMLPEPAFLPEGGQERIVAYLNTFRATRPFNGGMVACATVYLLSGDEACGQEARRRLMHLASWDPNGSTSLSHNDEPGTEIVRVMSRTYDWIYPLLTEEERRKVREVLAVRMPQLYKVLTDKPFEIHPYESHAMDYYIGDLLEACICMAGEIPVEEMLEYVLQQLWSPFFPPYGGDEGGWCEGPSYWQWSTATFLRNFLLVQQNCGVDLTRKPWLRNTPFFKLYANPPYSRMSPFGDGQSGPAGGGDTMYKLGVVLENPFAQWFAAQQKARPYGLERFLYRAKEEQGRPPSDLPQARCFDDIGLACMHSNLADGANNVHFMLRSCPFGAISHAYADQNAFTLHAYGEPLAVASGYYPYYASPHHSSWSWETKAANTLLVDGRGQQIRNWDSTGKIARFATTDTAHYALGDATPAYGGRLKRFVRHALFLRPTTPEEEPVVVLFDQVESGGDSTYDWLLHSLEQVEVDEATQTLTLRRNAARLKVQLLAPQGLQLTQSDQFTVPPEAQNMPNQWHLSAHVAEARPACRFLAVLLPYRQGQEDRLPTARLLDTPGWAALEIATRTGRHVVAFRDGARPGSSLKLAGLTTKADVLAAAPNEGARFEAKLSGR